MQPATKLEGEHVLLRELQPSDVTDSYLRWMNDHEIMRYTESRFKKHSYDDLVSYIKNLNRKENVFLAIILKETNTHIGNIKIGPINWNHRTADVGIIVGEKTHWGKRIATEAIQLIVQYAFSELSVHKLTAGCYAKNVGSFKAFLKAGFSLEGIRKEQFVCEGTYTDEYILGITNSNLPEGRTSNFTVFK